MNTTESHQIELDETTETSERIPTELHDAADLIDGAEHEELAGELILAAELTDEQTELALEAIAISPEGLKINAKLWRMRDWIAGQVAPQREAIQHARAFLFRGLDEREYVPDNRALARAIALASRD